MSSLLTLVSVSALLDAVLRSAAVVLLAVVVASLLRRASAAWRHLVWCLSAAGLLLLPVLSLALPDWRVAWLPQWTAQSTQLAATRQTDLAQADGAEPLDDATIVMQPSAATAEAEPRKEPHGLPRATIETTSPPRSAMPWLAIAWPAGGLLSLVPLAIGMWQLAGLRCRSNVIGDLRWLTLLDELRRQLAVRRNVQLRQSEAALAPLTWGALRPVLLLPFEAGAWPDERRRLVLLHELAHVGRWDWLTQLVAHVACAVYWFNPLVWLAAKQMRIERERACDDMVLASGARASDYARELLALAAGLSNSRASTLAAVPMARRGELEDRLHGILDGRRSRAGLTRRTVCLGAAFAAAAMVPLAMLRAAPPDSTESETAAPPKQAPSPAPVVDLGSAERQVKEADDSHALVALGNPDTRELWDLKLEEAVRAALTNSKVMRNMCGVLFTAVTPQSDLSHVARQRAKGPVEAAEATRGEKVRFVLARTNNDVALTDFEDGVRNLVYDVERAYWDLYYNYRNLAAVQSGRDSALHTWRTVYALHLAGNKGGEAEKEAQAREQYFLFRAQVENSLGLLYTAQSRLRYMMGQAPTDGRLIRPADEPTTTEVQFDLNEILPEALTRSVETRRKREVVEQIVRNAEQLAKSQALLEEQELELVHVLTNSVRDLDRNYQVSVTTFNRRAAAAKQVEAVKAGFNAGTVTLDMLLDAQRRLADAEIAYYRALVDYNVAILHVHFRKGSLLERNGILLVEETRVDFDLRK
ncbi:MAG TPA: M56 family metallopeptidase [Pirellulales bacterium]|nr:M56 family metallopeptidase [Pirellulales bacterium]